jgi:hypothetical protein
MFFHGQRGRSDRGFLPALLGVLWLTLLTLPGCNDRDRLTFPVNDGAGPQSTITDPSQDTTVTAGPFAQVVGRVTDSDGIDTVYFEVTGGGAAFSPHIGNGDDSVTFSLPLATSGFGGTTMTVMVFGTDIGGVRGDTAIRQVTVQ